MKKYSESELKEIEAASDGPSGGRHPLTVTNQMMRDFVSLVRNSQRISEK